VRDSSTWRAVRPKCEILALGSSGWLERQARADSRGIREEAFRPAWRESDRRANQVRGELLNKEHRT
jgi:hypothetical protein